MAFFFVLNGMIGMVFGRSVGGGGDGIDGMVFGGSPDGMDRYGRETRFSGFFRGFHRFIPSQSGVSYNISYRHIPSLFNATIPLFWRFTA